MRAKSILGILCIVVVVISCRKDPPAKENIDDQLTKALLDASDGNGIQHFILPESNQYELIPQDPKNPITAAKVKLGKFLFHETALGGDARYPEGMHTYSCATCHHADGGFQAL